MSNHQKRLSVPKSWPVERKEETFTVKAGAGPHGEEGVPLLIVLRDVLGYVDSRKEARYALNQDNVVINGTPINDEERPVGMFDIVAFDEREEYYRVFPDEGGRLALTPIDAGAAGSKLGKIDEKRHVPGGDVQLTLHDGQTLLVDDGDAYAAGDSLIVDNDTGDIVAHFVYEEGTLVTAVAGSHAGEVGTIDEIQVTPGSSANNVLVEQDDGGFETVEEYIVVIDENFTGDDGDAEAAGDGDTEAGGDESVDGDTEAGGDDDPEAAGDDDPEAGGDDDPEAAGDDPEAGGDDDPEAGGDDDPEAGGDESVDDTETADADSTTQEGTE